ncbi:MAG TPA: hypothetical protein VII96_11745 [Acidimicrobiales bacterium]
MRQTTNRIRLRIDLALTGVDDPTPYAPGRRELLAPPVPITGSDRMRPTLLAPMGELSVRLGSPGPLGS